MGREERILELAAEIDELEELLAKAERSNDLEGRWVVYLLTSLLERRRRALRSVRATGINLH